MPHHVRFKSCSLSAAILAALVAFPAYAQQQSTGNAPPRAKEQDLVLPTVTVTSDGLSSKTEGSGSYTTGSVNTATRFDMSLRDTPQSVSVITRTQMDDFGVRDVNRALELSTGINVERVETDRTYYTARGFDIQNFQVDGIGLPLTFGNVEGDLDTAIYDRIEVVRGGTGLMASMSDPSATINFVRKRPTRNLQASAGLTLGSWNYRRLDADISTPFNESGSVRGRLVAAHEDKDSYLDRYAHKKSLLYGIVEADLAKNTTFAIGHNVQYNDADSPLWGALPLYDTSGNPTHYDRSTSTATDWAYWDDKKSGSFMELAHFFDNGWQAKAVLTRNKTTEDSRLFYISGTPDPTTPGSDLYTFPSEYEFTNRQTLFDVFANGPFTLFGREHELMVGANWTKSTAKNTSYYISGASPDLPTELEDWDGSFPLPAFDGPTRGSDFRDKQKSVYGAVRINATDSLMLLAGTRYTDLETKGFAYGENRDKDYGSKLTPYYGASYKLNDIYSVYGSYTKIFRPQTEVDIKGDRLDPVSGKTYETGLKGEFFDKKLNASISVFRTKQKNLAEGVGVDPVTLAQYFDAADETSSAGYEFDLSGEVLPGLQLSAGYAFVDIEDSEGKEARTYTPRRTAHVAASYRLPFMPQMKVGANLKWQDDIYRIEGAATTGPNAGSPVRIKQDSYALVNLMARYEFSKNLSATLNLNNITDEKYINSLYWSQGYYGAPRNATVALNWTY